MAGRRRLPRFPKSPNLAQLARVPKHANLARFPKSANLAQLARVPKFSRSGELAHLAQLACASNPAHLGPVFGRRTRRGCKPQCGISVLWVRYILWRVLILQRESKHMSRDASHAGGKI